MNEAFNETNDLYLQILRKAQEVEDPRLVGMIMERLKNQPQSLLAADAPCVVIPFPLAAAKPAGLEEDSRFWPRPSAAQISAIFAVYTLLVAGHSLLG